MPRALALATLASLLTLLALGRAAPVRAQPLIVVDAGHGGTDPGAVGCSLQEADVVLDVALRLRTSLEAAGIRVALTRDVDEFVGLSARASFANSMSADGFVSIHSNSNAGTPASGTETWIANAAGDRSLSLASLVQAQMVAEWGLPDRGVKRADFVVVRDTTMPAALTELAFTNRCTPDAALLGSATERQAMAEAQARAILEWLGATPGGDGTLRGVVFEDQGVGTMDLSVRLPGATVRIVETGATATADSPDAAWLFTLPSGTYTVEASAPGHRTASRVCDVTSGGTTWCSVGLFPEAMITPDAAVAADAAVVAEPDAATVTTPDAATPPTGDAGTVSRPTASGCSCRVGAAEGSGRAALAMALALATVLVARRRARASAMDARAPLTALAVLGCGGALLGCAGEPVAVDREAVVAPPPAASSIELAREGAPVVLRDEIEVVLRSADRGGLLGAPVLSPDGDAMVLATADLASLHAWRAEAPSAVSLICATQHCGYEPRWIDATHVATRTPEQGGSAIPGDAFDLSGAPSAERLGAGRGLAWVEGEDTVRVRVDGITRTLRAHDDRFVRAELAPDRRFVVVWGLRTGLTLHRLADGARVALGAGGSPHFDPDGRALVFDRTEDEGHELVAGDVLLAELGDEVVVRPVTAGASIERAPSLSRIDAAGRGRIAFERDGAVVVASIELR
jgi:N-acetylmuramoyl-L-alanine amidase